MKHCKFHGIIVGCLPSTNCCRISLAQSTVSLVVIGQFHDDFTDFMGKSSIDGNHIDISIYFNGDTDLSMRIDQPF